MESCKQIFVDSLGGCLSIGPRDRHKFYPDIRRDCIETTAEVYSTTALALRTFDHRGYSGTYPFFFFSEESGF
ncbi:MAG: hypothetical protein RLY64_645 [Bacteroidota bacterium]